MKFGPENKWFKTSYLKFIFSFQIFEQKVSKPTKTSKKDHPFYNAVLPKKPYPFSEPQLTQLSKNILPAAHPKTLHALQTFQQTCFWLVSEKNIGTAPFPDAQELHSRSTWKANVCILRSSHRRCFGKKGVLGNSRYSQENTCVKVSFLIKLQGLQKTFFTEHLGATASVYSGVSPYKNFLQLLSGGGCIISLERLAVIWAS